MIDLIRQVIAAKLPGLLNGSAETISFLKYSTPTSGRKRGDKVLLFGFKPNEATPFLCVKTVRDYGGGGEVVRRNFLNLTKLNALVTGGPAAALFSRPLYLHDDGENIFSLESASLGRRVVLNQPRLEVVVDQYIAFQAWLAQSGQALESGEVLAQEIFSRVDLSAQGLLTLKDFLNFASLAAVKLPRLLQHGDLSPDNVLLTADKTLSIVDCDFAGFTDFPGFDLFSLFYRLNPRGTTALCQQYWPKYFQQIKALVPINAYPDLLFLCYFLEGAVRKAESSNLKSAPQIIAGFNRFFS